MSDCEKMIIKLSLGIRILVLQQGGSKGIICCFGEEQTLARKKYEEKKTLLDADDEKKKHLSNGQLHSQMSQDRLPGCSYFI